MPFLLPNQQRKSTESNVNWTNKKNKVEQWDETDLN